MGVGVTRRVRDGRTGWEGDTEMKGSSQAGPMRREADSRAVWLQPNARAYVNHQQGLVPGTHHAGTAVDDLGGGRVGTQHRAEGVGGEARHGVGQGAGGVDAHAVLVVGDCVGGASGFAGKSSRVYW